MLDAAESPAIRPDGDSSSCRVGKATPGVGRALAADCPTTLAITALIIRAKTTMNPNQTSSVVRCPSRVSSLRTTRSIS